MTEKHEDAETIISDIESQMALANLARRGEYAAGIALLAGDVLKTALIAGVPYPLAREMASDFWKAEMLADTVAALMTSAELEEDDQD